MCRESGSHPTEPPVLTFPGPVLVTRGCTSVSPPCVHYSRAGPLRIQSVPPELTHTWCFESICPAHNEPLLSPLHLQGISQKPQLCCLTCL